MTALVLGSSALASTGVLVAAAPRPTLAVTAGSTYVPLEPARILDTRNGTGRGGVGWPVPSSGEAASSSPSP
ncbi:MAG TPA: hypothetical protein VHF91_05805, partial [Acidimicrobiales bacterium]|nr:hypothetical protein [Acidimicrobiales bacterium]